MIKSQLYRALLFVPFVISPSKLWNKQSNLQWFGYAMPLMLLHGNDNAAKRDFLNLKRETETSVWIVS